MINDKGKIYYGLGLDNAQLRADAAEARSVIKGIGDTTVAEGNRIDGSMRKIGVAVMGAFSVQQAAQFAKTVVDVRGEIEALEKSFVVLAGHKGIPLFNEIRAFATDTTFQLGDLAKGAQTLMAFNIEADRVMPILRQIGDISMGNVDKFNSLILAFAQMSSKGKLMGQDLLQMINAGFNPLTIISEKTGKSIAQLKKEMEQGGITADMVADAFESATAAGGKFNGMLEDQSKGIKGMKSNLEGAWEEALNSIGEKNEEVIKGSIQGVTLLVQNYEKVGEVLAVIIGTYGAYKAALIATETARNAITTVRHTEEAASLYQLLTAEQQAMISKQGLSTTSAEYYALVKAESTANVQAAQATLAKARTEVSAASQTLAARRSEFVAAKQAEAQRAAELVQVKATGTTKQVEAAQRKLNAAQTQRESAAIAFQSATQDFHAKKTAVVTAAKNAEAVATATNTAAQTADATATGFLSVAKTRLTAVAARLNAVIMANPFALAAAAVVALGYGIYKLITYQTDAEKAQEKLNDAVRESEQAIDSERHQIDAMFARLKAAKEGTDEYRSAKEAIMSKYGEYLKGLGDETTALNDVAAAYTLITQEAKKAANARAMEAFTKDAADTLAKKEGEVKDDVYEMLQKKFKGQKGADGIDLAETYYWKIKPVLEGEGEITDEIQGIIDQFDKVTKITNRATGGDEYTIVNNELLVLINRAKQARAVFNNTMEEARRKFGENPIEDNGNTPPAFDAMSASLSQLMEQLPKARQELAALQAADKPDPAAIAAKQQEIQTIEAQTLARERQLSAIKDVKAQIDVLQKEQLNYAAGSDEYNALEGRIKALQTKLPKTGGGSGETEAQRIQRETAERNEQIQQYGEAVSREVRQAELDIAQSKIDAMEEGFAKQQAQVNLTYERMIFENEQRTQEWVEALRDSKELEWQNANPNYKKEGNTFDRSTVTAADLTPDQKAQIQAYADFAAAYQRDSNTKLLEDLLGDFQTYNQQREKIEAEFADKRKALYVDGDENKGLREGVEQGNLDELNRQEQEALTAVDEQFASREATYQAWMNSIANMTLEQLEAVLAQAERELAELAKQNDNDPKLAQARAKVATARQKVADKKAENEVSPNKRSIEEWNDLRDALNDVAGEFDEIGEAVGGVAGEIISTAGTVLTGTVGMINGIVQLVQKSATSMTATATAASTAIQTVEKASVILAVISAALQIATAIAGLFNNDEEHQEEIEALQGRIDQLQWELDNADTVRLQDNTGDILEKVKKTYAETTQAVLRQHAVSRDYYNAMYRFFGEAIYQNEIMTKTVNELAKGYANVAYSADKALGEAKYDEATDQLKNIAEQQLLIQKQIDEENAKKDTDEGAIKEYEQKIAELGQEAVNIINEIVEDIIGGSAADIAEELGDAFVEAFQNGEDAAGAWGDKVKDIVADVIKRMLVSKYLEEPLGAIFDKYKAQWYKDGEFAGVDAVIASMSGFAGDLNAVGEEFALIWESLPDSVKNMFTVTGDAAREASEKGIATASQESVDELNGRATAIQSHTYTIAECQKLLVETTMLMLEAVWGIERNTGRLETIESDMRSVKNTVNDIALKGIKLK